MGLTKYGTGDVIPEDEAEKKTAAANFTEDDKKALQEENKQADQ